jgi:hypothetical protein
MSHGDHVSKAPEGFIVTARTDRIPVAAMADDARRWYGVQFHPEVTHTKSGQLLLRRFVVDICGCDTLWTPERIIEDQVARVRAQVGGDEVILGLSGGVDSSVVAALLHKAIGDQLTCVFVDTGLLRWQEGDQVMATFAEHLGVKVIRVDAADRYFTALEGITDPEAKRKIIGNLDPGMTEVTRAGRLGGATQLRRHGLHAVANAQHRHAAVPHRLRRAQLVVLVGAAVAAGQDDPLGTEAADEVVGDVVGMDLAIDVRLAHPARDELRDLRAEIEDEDLVVHERALRPPRRRRRWRCAGVGSGAWR